MKKRKPKLPSWAGAVRSPLGASKDDAKQRLAAEDIAVERTKRRHAMLRKLDELRGDSWDLPEGRTQSEEPATPYYDAPPAKPLAHPVRERMDLVPWNGVLAVAETMTEGIKTHDEGAWRKLSQREHVSRALRHLALFLTGDYTEPHLHHAAARSLMALEMSEPESLPFREGEYDVEKD
jgi:hypothetical protein